jgi:dTDP-glucose pyrophosphorylase
MLGIIPAAGVGSRIQPLAFSKELLPVGSFLDGEVERPRAVSEYLIERMVLAGATRICFVISIRKSDIVEYYGASAGGVPACYVVQPRPAGLCDAIFQALPFIDGDEPAIVGLPDTVWFPRDGLGHLGEDPLSFLLFPVERPSLFDAVVTEPDGRIREIQVKQPEPSTHWIWGAFKARGSVLRELHALWLERGCDDAYIGTLVNAWIELGGRARGVQAGEDYVDVGTIDGYRRALELLGRHPEKRPVHLPSVELAR